jgi:hypothetical protein
MTGIISKTDYILYRECAKDTWFKIHKPELYFSKELSEFVKALIETGNEVELEARKLFLGGVLIKGRDEMAQKETLDHIAKKIPTIFQAVFLKDGFLAATDVMQWDANSNAWILSEVKATSERKDKDHFPDLAFQANLLKKCGLDISKVNLIHLNKEYIRAGALNLGQLFIIEDVTEPIFSMLDDVSKDMQQALEYLSASVEPPGRCTCVTKGRSNHCTMFNHINPEYTEYGIHDLARVSKKKLEELVDTGVYALEDIPEDFKLTDIQKNQVCAHKTGNPIIDQAAIRGELEKLVFPLYFLDYETYPCAIPRFDGFSPYQQIPFQYSLHILETPSSGLIHKEFLHTGTDDPSFSFLAALKADMGKSGSVLVWNKSFECSIINIPLAKRIPCEKPFIDDLNQRVFDLMEIFSRQLHVHPEFKGKNSIKSVLPVLVPDLSYKDLEIQEGGTASQEWNKIATCQGTEEERQEIADNLRKYCHLDTYAMYAIWKHLYEQTVI